MFCTLRPLGALPLLKKQEEKAEAEMRAWVEEAHRECQESDRKEAERRARESRPEGREEKEKEKPKGPEEGEESKEARYQRQIPPQTFQPPAGQVLSVQKRPSLPTFKKR